MPPETSPAVSSKISWEEKNDARGEEERAGRGREERLNGKFRKKAEICPMLPYKKGFQTVTVYDPKTSKQNMR